MTEKRIQQLIAKALASTAIDLTRYYHMCWWEGRLRCLHVHHTKDVHPVFFAAPGEAFAEALNERQWQLLTERIAAYCRTHNVTASGRPPRSKAGAREESSWQRPTLTGFDSIRLRRLLATAGSPETSTKAHVEGLRCLLETADTVSPEEVPRDVVTMNSRVRLKNRRGREEMRVSLVFPADASGNGDREPARVSVLTPTGLAILGRRVGDNVEGRVRIHELLYQPEAAGDFDL
ncbi:GreA/GreB family elongation factor [Anaerobaca lacustris]|uniref:GreA/GreB family elongation factor n=1 Tax=Anaerobaca lacustris TaxID=3044600 RepID=A0AAW6TQJ7_9BACT|nr:GreA/GreB family elongation factor [Sedimentisphaerales bacterium M17dextr]